MGLNYAQYVIDQAAAYAEKPVVINAVYPENTVRPIISDRQFFPEQNYKFANALVRMMDAMQIATDERPEPVYADQGLAGWDEELLSEGEEIAGDVIAEAIEKTVAAMPVVPKTKNAMELVSGLLVTDNPWQILEDHFTRIVTSPRAGDALVRLLNDSYYPKVEYQRMVQRILVAARNALEAYREKELKIQAAKKAKQPYEKHERGTRPADIYRVYVKPLRFLASQNFLHARRTLRELMLETTTPFSDLESPDYIDGYTGEIDPEAAEYRFHVSEPEVPAAPTLPASEDENDPEEIVGVGDCMMGETNTIIPITRRKQAELDLARQLSSYYADGYSAEDAGEQDWINELFQESPEPMWMKIQADFKSSDRYIELAQEARPYTDACRQLVQDTMRHIKAWLKVYLNPGDGRQRNETIIDIVMKLGTWEKEGDLRKYLERLVKRDQLIEQKASMFAVNTIKSYFPKSPEAVDFIDFLKDLVQRGESEIDIALIFISVQNGLMFAPEAAEEVKLEITGQFGAMTLYDFIEDNEPEILANLNDRVPSRSREPYELIEQVAEQGIRQAIGTGDPKAKNICITPEYIEGYINAAASVKRVTFHDSQGYHNTLEEAGWGNFRMKRCPAGAKLYNAARSKGATQKDAMKVFWRELNVQQRRKEEARIRSFHQDGTGVVLINGRAINWAIATMKLNGNEFEHTIPEWKKILAGLQTKPGAKAFAAAIQKRIQVADALEAVQ